LFIVCFFIYNFGVVCFIILLKSLIAKIEKMDHGNKENIAIVIPTIPAVAGTVIKNPAAKPIYVVDFLN